ncbi:MAG: hypothetical protein ACYTF3_01205 [Planctomycetota bacterium]
MLAIACEGASDDADGRDTDVATVDAAADPSADATTDDALAPADGGGPVADGGPTPDAGPEPGADAGSHTGSDAGVDGATPEPDASLPPPPPGPCGADDRERFCDDFDGPLGEAWSAGAATGVPFHTPSTAGGGYRADPGADGLGGHLHPIPPTFVPSVELRMTFRSSAGALAVAALRDSGQSVDGLGAGVVLEVRARSQSGPAELVLSHLPTAAVIRRATVTGADDGRLRTALARRDDAGEWTLVLDGVERPGARGPGAEELPYPVLERVAVQLRSVAGAAPSVIDQVAVRDLGPPPPPPDRDRDGLPDSEDPCPGVPDALGEPSLCTWPDGTLRGVAFGRDRTLWYVDLEAGWQSRLLVAESPLVDVAASPAGDYIALEVAEAGGPAIVATDRDVEAPVELGPGRAPTWVDDDGPVLVFHTPDSDGVRRWRPGEEAATAVEPWPEGGLARIEAHDGVAVRVQRTDDGFRIHPLGPDGEPAGEGVPVDGPDWPVLAPLAADRVLLAGPAGVEDVDLRTGARTLRREGAARAVLPLGDAVSADVRGDAIHITGEGGGATMIASRSPLAAFLMSVRVADLPTLDGDADRIEDGADRCPRVAAWATPSGAVEAATARAVWRFAKGRPPERRWSVRFHLDRDTLRAGIIPAGGDPLAEEVLARNVVAAEVGVWPLGYLLTWTDREGRALLARTGAGAGLLAAPFVVAEGADPEVAPVAAWNGAGVDVAWCPPAGPPVRAAFDASGRTMGEPTPLAVPDCAAGTRLHMVSGGGRPVVVEHPALGVWRVDRAEGDAPVALFEGPTNGSDAVWTGRATAIVAGTDAGNRLAVGGDTPLELRGAARPALGWNGRNLLIVGDDGAGGLVFERRDGRGAWDGDPVSLEVEASPIALAAPVWDGVAYVAEWVTQDGSLERRVGAFGCEPP